MAPALRSAIRQPGITRCIRVATGTRFRGLEGDRLTRVPFVMWCVSGGFRVHGSALDAQPLQLVPGEAAAFPANSFANVEFTEPCVHWRMTFEADGVLVGRERVSWPLVQRHQQPAGDLEATWFPGSLRQPEAGLLESLLAIPTEPDA